MSSVSFAKLGEYGRLGNALFQISALVSYCKKHNKTPLIPQWEYHKYFKNIPPPTEKISIDRIYNEPTFEHSRIPEFNGPVDLMGYFQSWLYHERIDINELFELTDDWKNLVDATYEKILRHPPRLIYRKKTAAIHFRRGDYLKPPHDTYHGVLPLSYYNNAISWLYGEEYKDVLFVVFSDDLVWAKQHFKLDNVYFVEHDSACYNQQESSIVDLFLMSKCDSIITANSSYSWWGAALGNKKKRVVMPKKWFAGADLNTQDLYLPNSIIL